MHLQSLVVVVLRLMALNFLLQVAVHLTPQFIQFFLPSTSSVTSDVFPWLILAGLIVSAVLLWILALPIARLVTRSLSQDLSFGSMSLIDCYSIAFMGVGLFYIASHLPQVLNWTHYLFKAAASTSGDSWKENLNGYDISQALISFIVGVVLFVNGRKWAIKLAQKQSVIAQQS